jgi:AcrR family transcriptional regulator
VKAGKPIASTLPSQVNAQHNAGPARSDDRRRDGGRAALAIDAGHCRARVELTLGPGLDYITDPSVINYMVIPLKPPQTATTARQRRKDARPQELLDAALSLFVEKGFAATRADEVAQRAGVSKGTLYLYYPSKEELFKAVLGRFLSSRIAATAEQVEAYRGEMGPLLQDLLVDWWQQTYASPASATFKIMICEVRNFPEIADYYVREVVEPGHALLARIVQRGIDSGEFRSVSVDNAVHSLLLPMIMLCTHKHALGACTPHQIDGHRFIADHVALVVRGLCADASHARDGRIRGTRNTHLESSRPDNEAP